MGLRFETRAYTNMILTVIAVMLVALVFNVYRIGVASPAQAQSTTTGGRGPVNAFSSTGRSAPADLQTGQVTQDVAVAAATSEVAAANRDIAAALRECAKSISGAGAAVSASKVASAVEAAPVYSAPAVASNEPAAPAGSAPATTANGTEPVSIQVEPSR